MEARKQYLENPCRAASVPYWKAVCISVPDNMKIVHDSEFDTELLKRYMDEPYFRLQHPMLEVEPVSLPGGYSLQEHAFYNVPYKVDTASERDCLKS